MSPKFDTFGDYVSFMQRKAADVLKAAPTLGKTCFLSGTTPVSCCHLQHAVSMDLDFVTKDAMADPSAALKQLKKAFGDALDIYEADRDFGMYRATLKTKGDHKINVDLLSAFESTTPTELNKPKEFPGMSTVGLGKYLRDKVLCLDGRQECKDYFHLCALAAQPGWGEKVKRELLEVEPRVLAEGIQNARDTWDQEKKSLVQIPGMKGPDKKAFFGWLDMVESEVKKRHVAHVTRDIPHEPGPLGTEVEGSRLGATLSGRTA